MSTIAPLDTVQARAHAEGPDGPRSASAQQRNTERTRAPVAYGQATSQHDAQSTESERVNPIATSDAPRADEARRSRALLSEPIPRERPSIHDERVAEEEAAYDQARSDRVGQLVDFYV